MRHIQSTILLAALPALLLSQNGLALEANDVFKAADPSVVVIATEGAKRADDRLGSGVIVETLNVVTSCHIVANAVKITVKKGSIQRSAKLRYQDIARDLCQLRLDDTFPSGKPVSGMVASKDLEVGQSVFAIGSPRGLEHTISRGIVSALREMKEENGNLVQTDAPVSPGSSGGGLFDSQARLIGIITFGFKDAQNLNFAVPVEWVQELAQRNRDRLGDAAQNQSSQATTPTSVPDTANESFPHVGDRWKYKLIDGSRPVGIVSVEIIESHGRIARERITRDDERGYVAERSVDTQFRPSRFQDAVTLPGGFQMQELAPYFTDEIELEAGQQWTDIPATFQFVQVGKKNLKMRAKVIRREKVRVPAGEFDAMLVEATGSDYFVQMTIKVTCRFWYAAQIKRSVKTSLQVNYSIGGDDKPVIYELAAYEPGK